MEVLTHAYADKKTKFYDRGLVPLPLKLHFSDMADFAYTLRLKYTFTSTCHASTNKMTG